jgi:hypothetical protein
MVQKLQQLVVSCNLETRTILDIAAVIEGLRPLCLLHIPKEKEQIVEYGIASIPLKIHHKRLLVKYRDLFSRESTLRSTSIHGRSDGQEWVELWIGPEKMDHINPADMEKSTGHALTYPECCCANYEGQHSLASYYKDYIFSLEPRFWQINRLATIFCDAMFLPDYFPCSLSCKFSKHFAEKFISLSYRYLDESTTETWINHLMAPLTVWEDRLIWWPIWKTSGETLIVDQLSAKSKKLSDIATTEKTRNINLSRPWLIPFFHLRLIKRLEIVKNSTPILSVQLERL